MRSKRATASRNSSDCRTKAVYPILSFLVGSLLTLSCVLNIKISHTAELQQQHQLIASTAATASTILQDQRVLVAIVAFDFSQIPHLEEVIDGYHDVCVAGASVDVVIYATVAYPVTLIDLWNTRFSCDKFSLTVLLKPKSLRLHLVDCHRTLFYEKISDYDLFVYTEDDIRISPSHIAAYITETRKIERLLQGRTDYKPSDFNVGIVRYEYNYPANVVIDDNTRHATQNVTRVYWEHSRERPVVPNIVTTLEQEPLAREFVTMQNHHQGMYISTRELLLAWKDRGPNCRFDQVRDRPGKGSQPTEGTQRVWMSSNMLYGKRHCNVQQVLPMHKFSTLTAFHLPNKNYRRVGKYQNRKFADGTEVFESPHESLLTAMELHLAMRKELPQVAQTPYRGIRMVDEVDNRRDRSPLLDRRMQEYQDYVSRGGILSEYDMTKTDLVEDA